MKKQVKEIEKALKKRGEREYKKGVMDAMSVAVNLFNVSGEIPQKVFKKLLKKGIKKE